MPKNWPFVGRMIHFSGGLRGENPPQENKVYVHPTIANQDPIIEIIESYNSIYKLTEKYGLIIGVDFYHNMEHVQGVFPPLWKMYTYDKGGWLGSTTSQKMAEIRNSAYLQGELSFVDSLEKVEAWTKAAIRALRSISEGYYNVLSTRCNDIDFHTPQPFDDMNCDLINDSMHNFFYYVGTLRDHIAEFIVFHIAKNLRGEFKETPKMAALKKVLEKKSADYGIESLKEEIINGYDINIHSDIIPGWLYMLKEYRNIITHEKPIDMIACKAWVWQLSFEIDKKILPKLKFPIPHLPLQEIDYFPHVPPEKRERIKRFAASQRFMMQNPDGLEVAWRILLQLVMFLDKVLDLSPILPEPICFDSSNSWGFKRTIC